MKIVCPNCHAAYAVELPELDANGVDVKCAKCLHVFLVEKESGTVASPTAEAAATSEAETLPNQAPESSEELPLKDEELDALMDDLIQKEMTQEPEATVETEPQTAQPADADLDGMIDDLLSDPEPTEAVEAEATVEPELKEPDRTSPPVPEEDKNATEQPEFPVEEPAESLEDEALDQMWEKAIEEGAQESPEVPRPEEAPVTPDSEPAAESAAEPLQEEEKEKKPTHPPPAAEAPEGTTDEAEMSEEDLWAQAFADQEASEALQDLKEEEKEEEAAPQSDPAEAPPESAPLAEPATAETKENEEDIWAQAFKDQEDPETAQHPETEDEEPVTAETPPTEPDEEPDTKEEEKEEKKVTPIIIGGKDDEEESPGGDEEEYPDAVGDITQQKFDDAAYAEFDDEDDEFAFKPRKRKLGPFVIPRGKKGNIIIAGVMVGLLLLIGSAYFGFQTFFPDELKNLKTAETEIPEGLTPREVPESDQTPSGDQAPSAEGPGTSVEGGPTESGTGESTVSSSATAPEQSEADRLVSELEKSKILGQVEKSEEDATTRDERLAQALAPSSKLVTLSTIMPVAYNPTDIRVLSFSMEMELSDPATAQMVRDSLPVYEKIMISTVEEFLNRKFYNDVLYVKEKLQKRLLLAMNKSIKGGKVKKTKFTDFAIQ